MFDPTQSIPMQVLRPNEMTMFDMSTILKDVATMHNAVGYAFRYSSDSIQWEKEDLEELENLEYIVKKIKDLDKHRGLPLKLFTLFNEKNSTKKAREDLPQFPQFSLIDNFLNSYIDFGISSRWILENELVKYADFMEDYAKKVADKEMNYLLALSKKKMGYP
ncbi:hypothetical protein LWI28_015066 [Acer negundo]|uniref:Uncharacterized protein n=1 Tax=Acer negundo TaxID=4023 RepID=A0AAD5NU21_ACENE|nr:hypothetical protein LWI28_015066 [Acer negundo]